MARKNLIACAFTLVVLISIPTWAQKATKNSTGNSNSNKNSSSSTTSSPSENSLLGTLEGIVHLCDQVSPGTLSLYKQIDQLFVGGQSAHTLDQMRRSGAYESAFKQVINTLQSLPAGEVATQCSIH